jgi:8-oxo-dGTP diphosphatase
MADRMHATVPVFLALIDGQNRVYLQRRFQTGYLDGQYEPPAGKVEEDEFPSHAACREALEEAGVIVKPEDLELFHAYMNLSNGQPWLGLMFRTRKWKGSPSIQESDKCDDAGFFSLDELPGLTPQVIDGMKHVLDGPGIAMPNYRDII